MGNREFNESFKPLDCAKEGDGAIDFDFEEIFRRLDKSPIDSAGWDDEETKAHCASDKSFAVALEKLFGWITKVKAQDQRAVKAVGTRMLAAMWVINPEGPSHMVAKSYGLHRDKFSRKAAEFSREFGIQNPYQVHDAKNKRRAIQ